VRHSDVAEIRRPHVIEVQQFINEQKPDVVVLTCRCRTPVAGILLDVIRATPSLQVAIFCILRAISENWNRSWAHFGRRDRQRTPKTCDGWLKAVGIRPGLSAPSVRMNGRIGLNADSRPAPRHSICRV
jgi:hypothetical protein